MPRRVSVPKRLTDLIAAAVSTFVSHGYVRAQVEDVADRMGVAKGTVYGYVSSKEALFRLALVHGDGLTPLPDAAKLPLGLDDLPAPSVFVAERLAAGLDNMTLLTAAASPTVDAASEVEQIVRDLLERLMRYRTVIKLVDRCAAEFPELAELWFGGGRWSQVDVLADYLSRQSGARRLHLPGDPGIIARSVIELCAMWAVHVHWDPSPRPVDDEVVLATVPAMVRQMVTEGQGARSRGASEDD